MRFKTAAATLYLKCFWAPEKSSNPYRWGRSIYALVMGVYEIWESRRAHSIQGRYMMEQPQAANVLTGPALPLESRSIKPLPLNVKTQSYISNNFLLLLA